VNVESDVNRVDKHDLPKKRVANRLRRMGLSVRTVPSTLGYDLLVNGTIRVSLRVAFPGMRKHRVSAGGRTYRYRYLTWHFNFHRHGRLDERYTDFFVCVAVVPGRRAPEDVFVIPWEALSGKTFSLHGGRRQYAGRYVEYRNQWPALAESCQGPAGLRDVA
jgi:hypothetical protein